VKEGRGGRVAVTLASKIVLFIWFREAFGSGRLGWGKSVGDWVYFRCTL